MALWWMLRSDFGSELALSTVIPIGLGLILSDKAAAWRWSRAYFATVLMLMLFRAQSGL
jgi:hypothetical protein